MRASFKTKAYFEAMAKTIEANDFYVVIFFYFWGF
jgi:hypothetical protein